MFGWYGARLLVLVIGAVLVVGGLASVALAPYPAATGVWAVILGLASVVAAIVERNRYRSDEAERTRARYGPGGGEPLPASLETRFRPTDERFEDPTTRQRMRVWTDPTSGERRYVAEE